MQQRSLFPDGFEIQERALAALRELDAAAALALVGQARAIDPQLAGLDPLEAALRVLLAQGAPRDPDGVAGLLLQAGDDAWHGRLGAAAADFVETAVGRWLLALPVADDDFLDAAERVPRALVLLLQGQAATARSGLLALLGDRPERADLWGWLGDACTALQRGAEADGCYVRALLLDVGAVDAQRLRAAPLRECLLRLRVAHGEALARELLLAEAWIAGALAIPPDNDWLDRQQVGELLAAAATAPGPLAGARQFALLLYRDRSRPLGQVDLADREAMAELQPDLFRRYMAACRARP